MEQSFTPEEDALIDELVSQYDPFDEELAEFAHPLTPEQKQRQREWSARLSMIERIIVMTELNRRLLRLRGFDPDNLPGKQNVSIVRRDGTLVRQIYPPPA